MACHRPPQEMLLDYAAGALPEPLALLVASHLTLAPESRREVQALEAVGGVLLEELEPAEMSGDSLDAVLALLDEEGEEDENRVREVIAREAAAQPKALPGTATESGIILPAPLRAYVGGDADCIKWRERTNSVSEYDVMPGHPDFRTRLLRIRAGAGVPAHTHEGREFTLVLDGSFSDECGHFARGDVEVADGQTTHTPVAGIERDCICLAVTDAPLRLTGPVGRLLNYFVDM